jgi:hypothetical protein
VVLKPFAAGKAGKEYSRIGEGILYALYEGNTDYAAGRT